jgi:tetratricopeptide (TPR) repeat protein
MTVPDAGMPTAAAPAVWGNVPKRNRNFTGRVEILARLRQGASSRITAVLPHQDQKDPLSRAVLGLGGVGKTAIAIEYAYRYSADYDLVWWIPADQLSSVRASLADLASKLHLDSPPASGMDGAIRVVLGALRRGEPYKRWLLVFDNADQPEQIDDFIPHGPGDVLITSRNHGWKFVINTVPMDVFTRPESTEFLLKRAPKGLTETDAKRLAEKLGDLPLALEQAGALLSETGMPADEYLRLIDGHARAVMAEGKSPDYPLSMTAAWALSVSQLEMKSAAAGRLLRLCAFLGPDSVPRDVFRRGAKAVEAPVSEVISDTTVFSRAIRELGRFALVTLDGSSVQMHRLVQALLRDGMTAEEREGYQRDMHLILAAATPDNPDDQTKWSRFRDLLPHVAAESTGVPKSNEPMVRDFALRMMRYADQSGDYQSSIALAERFIEQWAKDSGPDSPDVLRAQRHLGNALRSMGRYKESSTITEDTLSRARAVFDESDPTLLSLRTAFAADLRAQGDFQAARDNDEESRALFDREYGPYDSRSLRLLSSLALDYGLNSQFSTAKALYGEASTYMNDAESDSTSSDRLGAAIGLGWALRHLGEYEEALDVLQEAWDLAEGPEALAPEHLASLRSANGYTIVCRRFPGRRLEALEIARRIYNSSLRLFGDSHPDTLAIAISLSNLLRSISEAQHREALELAESIVERYPRAYGRRHPYYYGCLGNLAVLKRVTGDAEAAQELNRQALAGLSDRIGRDHHYSLTVATNLASDLAELGLHQEARTLGEDTRSRLSALLGPDHPLALGCAVNLSLDLKTLEEEAAAESLLNDALESYRPRLGPNHPDTVVASAGRRLDPDFDPPPI